ncbi:winged helix-turn-helix transcriptional regulator [Mangrovivirga cuniculi]|uniref:Transcriptional regulator n=1 Tax=Mangrovivirga cuniculi TaxID=2715131 RepID=A0A4D7JLV8_9BACT|nr:helix-turn-helix domain-containing protein [Mangrovivirga cuniculi]QCK15627.1 transcriptional regulator [Mangrovivirga cuniculi]
MEVRSHCPINFTLEHFGDKWSFLIIRDLMFKGKRHYNEFLEAGEKVSTSVLGDRLKRLEEMRIISKGQDAVKKSRIRYSLTQKGIDLLPMLLEMIIWGGLNDDLTESPKEFMDQAINHRDDLLKEIREQLIKDHLAENK